MTAQIKEPIFRSVGHALNWSFNVLATSLEAPNILVQFMPRRSSSLGLSGWDAHAQAAMILRRVEALPEAWRCALVLFYADASAREQAARVMAQHIAAGLGAGHHNRRAIQFAALACAKTRGYTIRRVADILNIGYVPARAYVKRVGVVVGTLRDRGEDLLRGQLEDDGVTER